jgi:hypothetical protein
MPLTSKGEEIKSALTKEYGAEKGEQVLYAGKNKGTFTGIDCDKINRIADAVNNLSQRFDAIVDAETAKVPEGRKKLDIKRTPMLPADEAYLKRMIEESKVKPGNRRPYTGPKVES